MNRAECGLKFLGRMSDEDEELPPQGHCLAELLSKTLVEGVVKNTSRKEARQNSTHVGHWLGCCAAAARWIVNCDEHWQGCSNLHHL
jgi:hypothetical protein